MTPIDVVLSKTDRSGGPDACWPWTGTKNAYGYGVFRLNRKLYFAHRVAYESVNGALGELCALHRCDNRPCCNPAHLFSGTRGDNSRDRATKGRPGGGGKKLTDMQVAQIRSASGLQRDIADAFGVSVSLVSQIRSNKHRAKANA